jgi:CubicO group peptidase (beta-lactamase class C family)
VFEIGSVTKTFTGLALAQLAVQRKVSLDEPLRPILFPDFADRPHETQITLLDLATHRSGPPSAPDNLVPKDPSNPFLTTIASRCTTSSRGTAPRNLPTRTAWGLACSATLWHSAPVFHIRN